MGSRKIRAFWRTALLIDLEVEMTAFRVGDRVRKRRGYRWPGVVVSSFFNLQGEQRYVVECTVPEVEGALHIYNHEQLEHQHGEVSNPDRHR